MSKILWDKAGEKFFENGVKNGVLYPASASPAGSYGKGVAWNGLISVTETPTGAEATPLYADNIKYLNLVSIEELEATIEAYTYPDEFAECDGSIEVIVGVKIGQQKRKEFGLCYCTTIGNDANGELGYKLHLLYGALAAPSERAYETINDSPDAITFSWDITTTPVNVTGYKSTALLTIDSRKVDSTKLADLLEILYGTDASEGVLATDPRLPLPDEIISILTPAAAPQGE